MRKDEIADNIIADIKFVSEKLAKIRTEMSNHEKLDIKQQADIHRYAETRLYLVKTLTLLEKW